MTFYRTLGIITVFIMAISAEVGCLIHDGVVIVDVRPVLQRGLQGKLMCEFHGTPQSVTWRKGNTFSSSSTLVLWHENVVDGESYRAGLVTLDANYSLVINRVDEDDAGRYYCNVTDYRGILIGNYTDVSVRDFLSVKGCSNTNCSLIYDRQDSGLLCQARNVPQDLVNIYWLHDGSEVSDIAYHFSKGNNGTQNIVAKLPISTGVQGIFTCVAESKVTQVELQRIAVTVTMIPTSATTTDSITSSKSKGSRIALIVGVIAGMAGIVLGVICLAKWLVCKRKFVPSSNLLFKGSITYMELWEMCSKIDDNKELSRALTQFIMGDDFSEKNKKLVDNEDIETVALAITKRHFESLGRETHMKPKDIEARNKENLKWLFRTDRLLEDWVSNQECSNYEIRCRLRKAAEKCDRRDVADICIEQDQCAIYHEKEPRLFIQNEQERTSRKEGISSGVKNSMEDTPSESTALLSEPKDESKEDKREQNDTESGSEKTKEKEDVEEASSEGEEDVGLVSSITIDEIQLIRKYADPEVVRSIAKDLKLDNPESVDDMDIVLALERERGRRRAGQRERIRKALKKTNAKYGKTNFYLELGIAYFFDLE
ncbi:uncharacterized protein [Diadema setosum]|uniref:uncharacterized protein n=1 Tax=Diadema setosum TaxID=31175 RepID=UPI003B3B2328